jgi:hypothetical protein
MKEVSVLNDKVFVFGEMQRLIGVMKTKKESKRPNRK